MIPPPLTEQQLAFFDTFGFLVFPGLFAAEIDDITTEFEHVWSESGLTHDHLTPAATAYTKWHRDRVSIAQKRRGGCRAARYPPARWHRLPATCCSSTTSGHLELRRANNLDSEVLFIGDVHGIVIQAQTERAVKLHDPGAGLSNSIHMPDLL